MTEQGYQHVVNTTKRWVNYKRPVIVTVNEVLSSGRGWFLEKKIELPAWISKYDVSFRIYYAVHELVHCMIGVAHDNNFKIVEDKLLELWDIRIERKKVYPRALYYKEDRVINVPKSMT